MLVVGNWVVARHNCALDSHLSSICEKLSSSTDGAYTAQYSVDLVGLAFCVRSGCQRTREILVKPALVVVEAFVVATRAEGHHEQPPNCHIECAQEHKIVQAQIIS